MAEDLAAEVARAKASMKKGPVKASYSEDSYSAPAYTLRNPPVRPTVATWKRKSTCVSIATRSSIKSMTSRAGYANSVGNLIEYSAMRCRDAFKQIQAACAATGKPFFDDTFFYGDRNAMYPAGTPADCTVTQPTAAERLSVLFPNKPVFTQGTDSLDIIQGAVGDCFLIGAVSALASSTAQHLNPVGRLFVASDPVNGIYGMVFYKNGGWEWVIIDDLIAIDPSTKAPLYACANNAQELWPMLLEKAYAKVHYCWDTIDGGWGREALADMTGGKEYTVNLYDGPQKDMSFDAFKALCDNVYTIMGCAVGRHVKEEGGAGRAGESGAVFGLYKGHAYSVLQAVKCSDGTGFVRVRNPWGNDAEWKGPYCDRGKEWTQNPTHFNEVKPNFAYDGAFWMKWDDFKKYFSDIDVCEYFDPTWNCVALFGRSNAVALSANQTYVVELRNADGSNKKIDCVLTVGQEDPKSQPDHGKAKSAAYSFLKLSVRALTSVPDTFSALKNAVGAKVETGSLYNRQVDSTLQLAPGFYSINPRLTDAPVGAGYNIRVLAPGSAAISVFRFDDPNNTKMTVGFQGVPPELNDDAQYRKAQDSRALKFGAKTADKVKANYGDGDLPEFVTRNPNLQPTAMSIKRKATTVTSATRSVIKPVSTKAGYGATVGGIYDYAAATAKAAFDAVVAACKAAGDKPFFDIGFHYGDRNTMYPDGTPTDCTVTEPRAVERLSVLFPNAPIVSSNADSLDIIQGATGDCFFIGAAAALASSTAQHLNPIGRLIVGADTKLGVYAVMFYKNGGWEWVIIDDYIAVDPTSKAPLYACANNNSELWPMLLEKAYAKVHYCWDTIDGGWQREALADMTGGKEYSLDLAVGNASMTFDAFKALCDNVFTVMGCAVGRNVQEEGGAGRAGESGAVFGLYKGHAYSVLQAVKCSDGTGFVRVRNPWGNDAEWKGPYCDRGKEWTENPTHFNEVKPNFAYDGAFWMKWDDFKKYFSDIDVCEYVDQKWNTATFFGASNTTWQCANQTYILEVKRADGTDTPVDCIISVSQEDPKSQPDHAKAKSGAYGYLQLSVVPISAVPATFTGFRDVMGTKIDTKRVYNRGVDDNLTLKPGKYSIIPKIDRAPSKTGYYIRVLAPPEAQIAVFRFDDPSNVVVAKATVAAAAPTPAAPTPTPAATPAGSGAAAVIAAGRGNVVPEPAKPVIPSIVTNATADAGLTFNRQPGGLTAAVTTAFAVADPTGTGTMDANAALIALGQVMLRSDFARSFSKSLATAGTINKAKLQELIETTLEDHGL